MSIKIITISDPRLNKGYPIEIKEMPIIENGFINWRGESREIREIFKLANGTQIELIE